MGIGCSFIKIGQWWLYTGYTLHRGARSGPARYNEFPLNLG